MNDLKLFLNEDGIKEAAIDVMDIADDVINIFDEIDANFLKLKSSLNCEGYNNINKNYEEISRQFPIIYNNIVSYSDDLVSLLNKSADGKVEIINTLELHTQEINSKGRENGLNGC